MSGEPPDFRDEYLVPETLDEAIECLLILRNYVGGDTPFAMLTEDLDMNHSLEFLPVVEVVQEIDGGPVVAVIGWKSAFDINLEPPEPPKTKKKRPGHLKLIK